ncbi:hypothetical protein ADK86_35825 [Streptomyces sp. NRRL F-5755]|uniref:hypothetical protein n=1 Tax=Streptomyces sp. NRRL F-5755 TaxID=1519475 RepID=UPI0006AF0A86|nr:hypothetical protein [Streptomyces sp. NRRL F-5755]KOT87601.1 hypothetical protein ADK86_35825 [Streptomyces sp. NRRL F-5755]
MSVQQSVAACGTARSRFGPGETAVVIVIIALAVLMTLRGLPLREVTAVLTSAGLLAVTVVGTGQGRTVRGAGRALLSCGPA